MQVKVELRILEVRIFKIRVLFSFFSILSARVMLLWIDGRGTAEFLDNQQLGLLFW